MYKIIQGDTTTELKEWKDVIAWCWTKDGEGFEIEEVDCCEEGILLTIDGFVKDEWQSISYINEVSFVYGIFDKLKQNGETKRILMCGDKKMTDENSFKCEQCKGWFTNDLTNENGDDTCEFCDYERALNKEEENFIRSLNKLDDFLCGDFGDRFARQVHKFVSTTKENLEGSVKSKEAKNEQHRKRNMA